jgi:hypothetical protein
VFGIDHVHTDDVAVKKAVFEKKLVSIAGLNYILGMQGTIVRMFSQTKVDNTF